MQAQMPYTVFSKYTHKGYTRFKGVAKGGGIVYNHPQVRDRILLCRRSVACSGHGGVSSSSMAAVLILSLPLIKHEYSLIFFLYYIMPEFLSKVNARFSGII